MPTETPLTDQINALTTYANTITGASDGCLSDAIETLADGYGGGGGGDTLAERLNGTMTSYSSNSVTKVTPYAFEGNAVTTVSLPNCTELLSNAFRGLSSLTSVQLPKVDYVRNDSFNSCTGITTLVLPSFVFGTTRSFQSMTALTAAEFGSASTVYASATGQFNNSANLKTLVYRGTNIPNTSTNSFVNTPFASGGTGGTLYVPQSLISSYQSDSNWSTILGYTNNQILAIEGSIYETQHVDGTPIE